MYWESSSKGMAFCLFASDTLAGKGLAKETSLLNSGIEYMIQIQQIATQQILTAVAVGCHEINLILDF